MINTNSMQIAGGCTIIARNINLSERRLFNRLKTFNYPDTGLLRFHPDLL